MITIDIKIIKIIKITKITKITRIANTEIKRRSTDVISMRVVEVERRRAETETGKRRGTGMIKSGQRKKTSHVKRRRKVETRGERKRESLERKINHQ